MNDQTRLFLKRRFMEYYSGHPVMGPPGLAQREWGFLFYDDVPDKSRPVQMHRHKSFNSIGELNDYLRSTGPQHAYHSAAYYQYPQAPTMLEKKWLGADLVFDLDADHLPNPPKSYSGMLEMVKREIIRLVDEFLIDDMGFHERDMDIVFSGGRGYHVHIRDERVKALKSPERREIVDYILGTGLNTAHLFTISNEVVGGAKGDRTTGVWRLKGFEGGQGGYGWSRRVAVYMASKLREACAMQDRDAMEYLKRYGFKARNVKKALESLREPSLQEKILKEGRLELYGNLDDFFKNMLDGTITEFKVDVAGKTDEPVTADIKRLIRLPGSIHGGTSFRVVPLTRKQLETFNPLEDAIIFGDEPVRVLVLRPQEVEVKGNIWRVSEGVGRLPESVAMFLMCRGYAEYEP
ncbi:DNA primase catalytic subunit PriS [Methanocella conradii]|uniref:DNA primase catalytic subunit PriS n=1 Tax=Methanocella conradii TaxID=1175444 RepID=UPI0024B3BAB5|nr:DNA primase catalytic subunit PriS [Methanocella conradii]MDI6896508.1 DNA primase catalytic subunit PriS [Methanocella conradii]